MLLYNKEVLEVTVRDLALGTTGHFTTITYFEGSMPTLEQMKTIPNYPNSKSYNNFLSHILFTTGAKPLARTQVTDLSTYKASHLKPQKIEAKLLINTHANTILGEGEASWFMMSLGPYSDTSTMYTCWFGLVGALGSDADLEMSSTYIDTSFKPLITKVLFTFDIDLRMEK